ncbi:hypothetical protein [Hymenobacter daeguensis]
MKLLRHPAPGLLSLLLLLLASCHAQDHEPTLVGTWASHSETDYAYPSASFRQVPRRYGPTAVIGKYRMVITPDSFIHFSTRGPFPRRVGAHSYQHMGAVVFVPESQRQFQVKILTADTLELVYARPTPTGTQLDYGHVDTGFTYTRLPAANALEATVQRWAERLQRFYHIR